MRHLFKHNKARLGLFAVIVLVGFVITIVWLNYTAQVQIRKNTLDQFRAYATMEAAAFSHFFAERKDDLEDLAAGNQLMSYYENKALGMTKEYGLWASLTGISELFERYVSGKKIGGHRIYDNIALYDDSGKLLADSKTIGSEEDEQVDASYLLSENDSRIHYSANTEGNRLNLIISYPYFLKEKFVGTIVARLNTKKDLKTIINKYREPANEGIVFFNYNDTLYSLDSLELSSIIEINKLPVHGVIQEKDFTIDGRKETYLAIRSHIDGTTYCTFNIVRKSVLLGDISPWQMLGATTLLAFLVMGGVAVIFKMATNNLLLQVRVAEASKQEVLIRDKNKRLRKEVNARKNAEVALQRANEELEARVAERTAELQKQTNTLKQEVIERREAENALRIFFNNTHDAIFIHDAEGKLIEVNERMLEMYGVNRDEALQLSIIEDYSGPGNDVEWVQEIWAKVLEGEEASFEWNCRRPEDGSSFEVQVILQRIELDRKPLILANVRDISEQKKIQYQQQEYQEFLNTVFEGIGASIYVFDPHEGSIVDCNSMGEELLGLDKEQIRDKSCHSHYPFISDSRKDLLCPEWHDQGTYEEGILYFPDNTPLPISRHLFEVHIGGQSHLVEVVFDISERKNLERKLNIAQKLESIGLLASGIAHEINTPIQYIGDNLQFIKNVFADLYELFELYEKHLEITSKLPEAEKSSKQIKDLSEEIDLEFIVEEVPNACITALEGVQRVASIVLAMKNFSHPGEEQMKAVDINKAIENTVTVARNEWKYVADVETDLEEDLPLAYGLPGGINQVLLNILVNAAHAINENENREGKGTISIATSHRNGNVEIKISDSGCGISKENVEKVFDPFFTTKEVGKGTGQGLAIVHDIVVEKHGGSIDIESEPGTGTTFTVKLPVREHDIVQGDIQ